MYFHNFAEMKLIAVNLLFTLNNIQLSKQQEQCLTESNEPCVLPFKYKVYSYTYEYRMLYNCRAVDKGKQFSTKDAPMSQIQKESFGVLQKWMKMENTFITVRTMDTVNNHVSSKTGGRL